MKRFIFGLTCLFAVFQMVAQSSGGLYTLQDLAVLLPNRIQVTSPNHYRILQDVALESQDTLLLLATDEYIFVENGKKIQILGVLQTQERTSPLLIQGDSTQNNYFEIYFESNSLSTLSNVHIQYCQHIKLLQSDIYINACEFDHFSDHVISYLNCDPVIENSHFHDNQACAIQSAINTDGCPKILNNVFYNNVLANTNNPQINIGPGTTDTIFIVGNRIEGVASSMSGGIGISNLTNPAITKLVVKDNIITHNRYGYAQNGYHISSLIADNQFIENNLEVNPINGGSGISIYGYDTTCAAKLRHNLITGNLWGVTAISHHHVDMGTEEDYGYNVLYDNGNGGVEYELYNNANCNMNAVGNYWGCDNAEAAEAVIFHQADNPSYGLVNYQPIYVLEPEILSFNFYLENNPGLAYPEYYNNLYGTITPGDSILFYVSGCILPDLTNLKPTIVRPLGVSVSPSEDEGQDFESYQSIPYTVSTPHQTSREYLVIFDISAAVPDNDLTKIILSPNPVTEDYFLLENPTEETLSWQIFTSAGQCVLNGKAQPGTNHITTKTLKPGMYIVYIQKDKTFVAKKLIVR